MEKENIVGKNKPKKSGFLLGLILGILFSSIVFGCILFFCLVDKGDTEINENVSEQQEQMNVDFDLIEENDDILKDTYGLFSFKQPIDLIYSLTYPRVEYIINDTLSAEQKNYIAFANFLVEKAEKKDCKNYNFADQPNDGTTDGFSCGNYLEDGTLVDTIVIKEDELKMYVEKIFGSSTYEAQTFSDGGSCRMYYAKGEYFRQCAPMGGTDGGYEHVFSKAYKAGKLLIIEERVEPIGTFDSNKYLYTYVFELVDGNYIFHSLDKALNE